MDRRTEFRTLAHRRVKEEITDDLRASAMDSHFSRRMSLYRLSISLHCWPSTRPERRRAAAIDLPDQDRPIQRIPLYDQVLDGDDRRELEFFDSQLNEGLREASTRLRAITKRRLDQLRALGYATRIEIAVSAEPGEIDFEMPAEFIRACGDLELPVQVTSDQLVLLDPSANVMLREAMDVEELKPSDLF